MNKEIVSPTRSFMLLLGEVLTPSLKACGFRRKKQAYYVRRERNYGIIEFQKSRRSNKEKIIFTANIGVVSDVVQEFLSGAGTDACPDIDKSHWRCRIGSLLPEKDDKWWTIEANTSIEILGREIIDNFITFAIPAIEKFIQDQVLRDIWLSGAAPGLTDFQRLLYLSVLLKTLGPINLLTSTIQELQRVSNADPGPNILEHYLNKLEQFRR